MGSLVIVAGLFGLTFVAISPFAITQISASDPPCMSPNFGPSGGCLLPAGYSLSPDSR